MGRSTYVAGYPGRGLFGILFLVMVMAGAPVLFKEARAFGRAVSAMINVQIATRL